MVGGGVMGSISVRHSVAQAYGLLLGRPLSVIGLTWLPAVFYAVGASYLIRRMDSAMALAVPSAGGLLGQYAFFYFVALLVATAFFGALIAVPLTRQAFGLREERVAAHLVLGGREFRLFLALLRYYVVVTATLVAFAVGGGILISQAVRMAAAGGAPAVWQGVPLETWFNSVGMTLATIATLVMAVRWGFLIDAIAAVEDHAGLGRAAALSRHRFWPIAATLAIIVIPAGLLLVACEMTFGGLSMTGSTFAAPDATPFAVILTVGLVVLHTLAAGASAGAYAELAEAAAQESETYGHARDAYAAPAAAFAQAAQTPAHDDGHGRFQAAPTADAIPAMDIATPEADAALAGAQAWMAPPPDAHFGSDPHDAQPHESHAEPVAAPEAPASEPLAEAVALAEAAHAADHAHAIAAQNAAPAEAPTEAVHAEAVVEETAAQALPPDVPDHALHAEFPAPPLDPAGAMAAQAGFHRPG